MLVPAARLAQTEPGILRAVGPSLPSLPASHLDRPSRATTAVERDAQVTAASSLLAPQPLLVLALLQTDTLLSRRVLAALGLSRRLLA